MSAREAACADFPTYYELALSWRAIPPADIQLARIAAYLGMPSSASAPSSPVHTDAQPSAPHSAEQREAQTQAGIAELQQAGFPVFEGPLHPTVAAMLADLPLK